jgi:23S rRNA U2552 (ribose-2'-O)-methylase RlmE/FtsJ
MPLCYFDSTKTNFILINDTNYILINKKVDDDYELYQLNKTYDIVKIEKPHEMIEDDIQIPGISENIPGSTRNPNRDFNLLYSYRYHNEDIFRNYFNLVWTTGYPHFNRFKDIIYKKTKNNAILYENNMNIILAVIFMNKLETILLLISEQEEIYKDDRFRKIVGENQKEYYKYERTKLNNNFNEIKTGILYDYISRDHLFIKDLDVDTLDKLIDNLNKILSNIESLDFTKDDIKNQILNANKIDRGIKTDYEKSIFELIISDIAPNTTGIFETDHIRIINICNQVFEFSNEFLKPSGNLVMKIFMGGAEKQLVENLKTIFKKVAFFKPNSSRKESKEIYLVCLEKFSDQ